MDFCTVASSRPLIYLRLDQLALLLCSIRCGNKDALRAGCAMAVAFLDGKIAGYLVQGELNNSKLLFVCNRRQFMS